MSEENSRTFRGGRSIASHLEITIDSNNPPPAASQAYIDVRQHVASLWTSFEAAESSLLPLDDDINQGIREWLPTHPKVTGPEIRMERARITLRLYVPRIEEADTCWGNLKEGIKTLEEAAKNEPETIEGRATIEIDIKVMNDNLGTVQQIIQCAKVQLEKAKALLKSTDQV